MENFVGTLNYQEFMLPNTYVSMRSLEFEEFPRFAKCVTPGSELENWTAFSFFQTGIASVFMGQEYGSKERFNFQSGETINWAINQDLTPLINRMSQIKKREVCKSGYYDYACWRFNSGTFLPLLHAAFVWYFQIERRRTSC